QKDREEVFVNPQIVERKGFMEDEEGCLSFPGLYQKIRRSKTIKVRAYNLKGELVEKVVTDLEARAWQHEIDHLNDVLFIGMKELALERGIPVLQPESINTPEGVASLQALSPDLLVVAAYGQILSRDVLASARHGGINVHASLLPKYRGAAPINWAIYHGETQTGVTIIKMSIYLDAGDMLAQDALGIGAEETAGEL